MIKPEIIIEECEEVNQCGNIISTYYKIKYRKKHWLFNRLTKVFEYLTDSYDTPREFATYEKAKQQCDNIIISKNFKDISYTCE